MILITGTSGFIGSRLLEAAIDVFGKNQVVAFSSKANKDIDCNYILHNNYIFDKNIFIDQGYEDIHTIIHAGAFTPKASCEADDIHKSTSNVVNTYHLISAVLPNLKRFIYLSTIDIYGVDTPISELSPISPISLYGESKFYCEKMVTSWARSNNVSCLILRIGHVYGPGEEVYKKLIPTIIRQIIDKKPLTLYGDGQDLRSFIFISDVVNSIINSVEVNSEYEIINVVGDQEISIKSLIGKIIKISGKDVEVKNISINTKPRHLTFDNSKLKKVLYSPIISLDEGLKIEWEYFNQL